MSTAGALIDTISDRVRDPNNTAHSRAFLLDLVDRAQVVVNVALRSVLVEENLVTTEGQALYRVETSLPLSAQVLSVRYNNAYLDEIKPWRALSRLSRTWLQDVGELAGFATIGRSLLVLHPAPDAPAPTVTTVSTKITATLASEAALIELNREYEPMIVDMVVAWILARQRDLDQVMRLLSELRTKLSLP
jgi:hypothetical protein